MQRLTRSKSENSKFNKLQTKTRNENAEIIKKRKPNGFMLWAKEERTTISKNDGLSGQHIMKILGARWRKLSADEKLEWQLIANEDTKNKEEAVKKKNRTTKKEISSDNIKNKRKKSLKV